MFHVYFKILVTALNLLRFTIFFDLLIQVKYFNSLSYIRIIILSYSCKNGFWQKYLQLKTPLPFRAKVGFDHVIIKLCLNIYGEFATKKKQFTTSGSKRNHPLISGIGLPIGCDNWSTVYIPAITSLTNNK